jgi:hypothetical protein
MYVNTSLRREDANHREEIHKVDTMIRGSAANRYPQPSLPKAPQEPTASVVAQ